MCVCVCVCVCLCVCDDDDDDDFNVDFNYLLGLLWFCEEARQKICAFFFSLFRSSRSPVSRLSFL